MKILSSFIFLLFFASLVAQDTDENWAFFTVGQELANIHKQDNLLYATHRGGISLIDLSTNELQNLTTANTDLSAHNIIGSVLDQRGYLYVLSAEGILSVIKGKEIVDFKVFHKPTSLTRFGETLQMDEEGNVYFVWLDEYEDNVIAGIDRITPDFKREAVMQLDNEFMFGFLLTAEAIFYYKNDGIYKYNENGTEEIFIRSSRDRVSHLGTDAKGDFYYIYYTPTTGRNNYKTYLQTFNKDQVGVKHRIDTLSAVEQNYLSIVHYDKDLILFSASDQEILIYDHGDLSLVDKKSLTGVDKEEKIYSIYQDNEGTFWSYILDVNRTWKLVSFDDQQQVQKHELTNYPFSSNFISKLLITSTDEVVIANSDDRIFSCDGESWDTSRFIKADRFKTFYTMATDPVTGRIWYGGEDLEVENKITFRYFENEEWTVVEFPISYTVGSESHRLLVYDDHLYVGRATPDGWFHVYDGEQWKTFNVEFSTRRMHYDTVEDHLLLSTTKGLYQYDRGRLTKLRLTQLEPDDWMSWAIRDKDRQIIYSLDGRIYREQNPLPPIPIEIDGSGFSLPVMDEAGKLWIGSKFGLLCFENEEWKIYDAGIGNNYIYKIVIDSNNNKWLNTAYGLALFNENGLTRKNDQPTKDYSKFNLFPNPVQDQLIITFPESYTINTALTIYNILGQQLLTQKLIDTRNTIDLSGWALGTYIYTISGDVESTGKLLKL